MKDGYTTCNGGRIIRVPSQYGGLLIGEGLGETGVKDGIGGTPGLGTNFNDGRLIGREENGEEI